MHHFQNGDTHQVCCVGTGAVVVENQSDKLHRIDYLGQTCVCCTLVDDVFTCRLQSKKVTFNLVTEETIFADAYDLQCSEFVQNVPVFCCTASNVVAFCKPDALPILNSEELVVLETENPPEVCFAASPGCCIAYNDLTLTRWDLQTKSVVQTVPVADMVTFQVLREHIVGVDAHCIVYVWNRSDLSLSGSRNLNMDVKELCLSCQDKYIAFYRTGENSVRVLHVDGCKPFRRFFNDKGLKITFMALVKDRLTVGYENNCMTIMDIAKAEEPIFCCSYPKELLFVAFIDETRYVARNESMFAIGTVKDKHVL